jgi:hypothetical protein
MSDMPTGHAAIGVVAPPSTCTPTREGSGSVVLGGMRARLEELGGRLYIAVGDPARAFAVSAWLPAKDVAS